MSSLNALVTEEAFLALPESNTPIELVDGEVIVSPSPHFLHQKILTRLVARLLAWAESQPVTVAQAPLDVRLGPGRILQPDAMLFSETLPDDVMMPIESVPALCVEVLSANRAYDRLTKRYLYAEAGVAEYWIVDTAGTVERRHGPGLSNLETLADQLTSPLLPGFVLDLKDLFAS